MFLPRESDDATVSHDFSSNTYRSRFQSADKSAHSTRRRTWLQAMGVTALDEGGLTMDDVLYDDLLKERVHNAIILANEALEDESLEERTIEAREIAQRAYVEVILDSHDDAQHAIRAEVEDTLSGLKQAEATFLSFASDVDDLDHEVPCSSIPFFFLELHALTTYFLSFPRCTGSNAGRRRRVRAPAGERTCRGRGGASQKWSATHGTGS